MTEDKRNHAVSAWILRQAADENECTARDNTGDSHKHRAEWKNQKQNTHHFTLLMEKSKTGKSNQR
jgi:hypothetical protein